MTTLIAQLISADGSFADDTRAWSARADDVLDIQHARIPVRIDHDGETVGEVVHLERDQAGNVWAVARLDDDFEVERGAEIYASPETIRNASDGGDIEITGVGLVERTAHLSAWPVTILRSGLDQHGRAEWRLPRFQQDLINHAPRRRTRDPLIIRDDNDMSEMVTNRDRVLERNDPAELTALAEEEAWARGRRLRRGPAIRVQRQRVI